MDPDKTISSARLTVLVVDDNRDAADTLAMLIHHWGFGVQVAYDGFQALEIIRSSRPDCMILDISMPRMDGYSVAEMVRHESDAPPINLIALTAFSDEYHVERARQVGFNTHLIKPANPQEIERILTMLDEVKQLTKQNGEILKEVKSELKEVKGELKELKNEVKEIKHEIKDIK